MYLYAIVKGSSKQTYGSCGIDDARVYTIPQGKIAAVVSDLAITGLRPERRHLAAHQRVLQQLMKKKTPLPVSFGVIAENRKTIRNTLAANQEAFMEQLLRVEGKMEMGLRVTLDVPNIFEYFVDTHPQLRLVRDEFYNSCREPTRDQKIELGRVFDRLLHEDREHHTQKTEDILAKYCFEIRRNRCRGEREVMNLACLVGREAEEEFETSLFKAANLFDNNFTFDYNGPWAPSNFVDMELEI